jgi:2-dehydropantoate 2-reductase
VARALEVNLPFESLELAVEEVVRHTAQNHSSMLQDVWRGARTEIDSINGAIVRMGEEQGIPTPVNRTMWQLIMALSA